MAAWSRVSRISTSLAPLFIAPLRGRQLAYKGCWERLAGVPDVTGELRTLAESGEHRKVEQAALLELEARSIPGVAPAILHADYVKSRYPGKRGDIPLSRAVKCLVSTEYRGESEEPHLLHRALEFVGALSN
jgi:hypothetical protein